MVRVLLVEDDPAIRTALTRGLAEHGHVVVSASTGAQAVAMLSEDRPDVIVLDLGLPDIDGADVLQISTVLKSAPVIVATARDDEREVVRLLNAGADDYLVKPFELDELFARVRALLRRSSYAAAAVAGTDQENEALAFADLKMDLATREVTRGGRPVELTRTEFTLLEMFMAHPRQVLTREQILKAVWGFDFEPSSNSLDVYVMYLRRKTEAGGEPRLVHTVRGVGYVLRQGGAE